MSKADIAIEKHGRGYNCAQAVACAFAEDIGVDEAMLYKACEGFGGGMGCGLNACGALMGAAVVNGMVGSDGNIEHAGGTKRDTVRNSAELLKAFTERTGALSCKDIKTGNNGGAFTSCVDCIRIGVEVAEEILGL